jgi:membrane-associated phospholipid phosphatase
MRVFWGISVMGLTRCFVMYLVPLEPPISIIPLRDPFVEGVFYDNRVLVKDLFFSGHTSNMVLLTLLMDIKWLKIILAFASAAVGYLLMVQHVHYAIDIIAAPFFAYLAYRAALAIAGRLVPKCFGVTPDTHF